MKYYDENSIKVDREKLNEYIGSRDVQVTEMLQSHLAMQNNSHQAKHYLEWCLKDAERIGDSAYVVEDTVEGFDYCCIMRKVSL